MNTKLITLLLLATLAFGLPAISEEPKAKDDAAAAATGAAPEAAKKAKPEAETDASSEASEAPEPKPEAAPGKKVKPKPEADVEAKGGEDEKPAKDAPAPKTGKNAKVIPYPLKTCIVTDNKLGSMGDPLTKVHEGQEIKFCCKPCVKTFDKSPAKYLKKLKENS